MEIGYYHFIIGSGGILGTHLMGKSPFYAYAYNLKLKMYQIEVDFLGGKIWINVRQDDLTFLK